MMDDLQPIEKVGVTLSTPSHYIKVSEYEPHVCNTVCTPGLTLLMRNESSLAFRVAGLHSRAVSPHDIECRSVDDEAISAGQYPSFSFSSFSSILFFCLRLISTTSRTCLICL
jgi:hypothetical protein